MFGSLKARIRRKRDGSPQISTPNSLSVLSPAASRHTSESALPLSQTTSTSKTAAQPIVTDSSNAETARASSQEITLSTPKGSERWSELKQTALGTLKTLLELGALASQAVPIGAVKGALECSSYLIKMVEVGHYNSQCRALRLTKPE